MRRPLLLVALLALAAVLTTWDMFDAQGQRAGTVRERAGGAVEIFDRDSRRIGWGRRGTDGSLELFDMRGNRIGESRGGRIILTDPTQLRGKERRP